MMGFGAARAARPGAGVLLAGAACKHQCSQPTMPFQSCAWLVAQDVVSLQG